ncbi:MAG: YcxB family protein [Planctomycetota bacterium]|nr:YcxB family protein [Planctomycetota bacterium]
MEPAATEEEVEARFRWNTEAAVTAMRWHGLANVNRRERLVLTAFLLFFGALMVAASIANHSYELVVICVPCAVLAWAGIRLEPWLKQRQLKVGPDQEVDVAWTLSTAKVCVSFAQSNSRSSGVHEWSAFERVVCTPEGMLFYQDRLSFQWLPRSAFQPGDFVRALKLARAHARQCSVVAGASTDCPACGHDLRTIAPGGPCPECGATRR